MLRQIADQRRQDEILQAYLDQVGTLLLENDSRSSEGDLSEKTGTALSVARARTLTVLPRLDGDRKYSVLRFLAELQLIDKERRHAPLLVGADLSGLMVRSKSNLRWNLSRTVLHGTDLSGADLHDVFLRESSLSNTDLSGANLSGADLTGADLGNAILSGAIVTKEQLAACESLKGATMPDGQRLKSDHNPDGPTFKKWLKSKDRGEDRENPGPS